MARIANQKVLRELESRIVRRDYVRGEFLPAERTLAEELGVGRCVIRGALAALREAGLVYRVPGKGLCVARHDSKTFSRVLVICPPVSAHPYEELRLIEGISVALDKRSAEPRVVFCDDKMPYDFGRFAALCREGSFHGVLAVEVVRTRQDFDNFRANIPLPYVLVDQECFFDGVCARVDFRSVGRMAGRRLLAAGHRDIGCISGPLSQMIYKELLAGFRGALAEEEVYLRSDRVLEIMPSLTPESYRKICDFLRSPERPRAIFTMRDRRADFLYRAAGELGIRIPQQLSVISYDDVTWPDAAEMGLSTISQPLEDICGAAVEMLRNYCLTNTPPESRLLEGGLLERSSIAPCR